MWRDANGLEIANNAYRDGSSGMNNTEESFLNDSPQISVEQRKMNAVRAYFEWMPLRYIVTSSLVLAITDVDTARLTWMMAFVSGATSRWVTCLI